MFTIRLLILNCIRFVRISWIDFGRSYLLSDSHINTVISDQDGGQDGVENRDK